MFFHPQIRCGYVLGGHEDFVEASRKPRPGESLCVRGNLERHRQLEGLEMASSKTLVIFLSKKSCYIRECGDL